MSLYVDCDVAALQAEVMRVLGPLWQQSKVVNKVPDFARRILSILTKTTSGPGRAPPVAEAPSQQANNANEEVVRQITDMGFSAAQARESLRQTSYGVSLSPHFAFSAIYCFDESEQELNR